MNILFFVVFMLFSLLILRLGIVQIVYGDDYKREIDRKENVTVNTSVPRGKILDRNGKIVVGNKPLNAITYTRPKNIKQEDILKVAVDLAKLIKKDTKEDFKEITVRDKKDFWILKHPKEAGAKVSSAEIKKFKNDTSKIYQLTLDRITEKEFNSFSKDELEILAIYREMNSGYPLSPQVIKNKNVTPKEFAVVSENLDKLPGVDTTTDWERYNVYKDKSGNETLGSVIGKISSSKEGLPKELVDYYLARDYSRNDRVGKSYIEYQYEYVLQGQKEKVKNVTDKAGRVLDSEVVRKGKRGDDLVLSVDIDFQKRVEKIIKEELGIAKQRGDSYLLDRAFVTAMNPRTGEILALGGKQYVTDPKTGKTELNDFALGNLITSYAPGSVVKGATILTGYQTGAIQPGQYLYDQPLHFASTPPMKSWIVGGMGSINDLTALKRSSNVYMFLLAMRLGGQHQYVPEGPLRIDKISAINAFRKNFAQFGLGVKTGVDLPGEQVGFSQAIPPENGNVLHFAIGQFDTYTPLQLAQYVSTIANGGYRIQPHIAKEIREPNDKSDELGPVIQEIEPKILNKVNMKTEWINRVKEGFWKVVNETQGTGNGSFEKDLKVAGKTGTAEGQYDGPKRQNNSYRNLTTWNSTFVGYAPYDNPEIAISVVLPWSYIGNNRDPHTNLKIANRVFQAYFDLKKEREEKGLNESTSTKKVENIKNAKKKQGE